MAPQNGSGGRIVDAIKTKAGGVAAQPALDNNSMWNATRSPVSLQQRSKAGAIYAGTVIREARKIVELINKRGPGPGIKLASQRLREALDSLDWICEYVENEGRS